MDSELKWIVQDVAITPDQCRAGRALVGWSASELAERAGVGRNTVVRFEQGRNTTMNNLRAIIMALTAAGVVFEASSDGRQRLTLSTPKPEAAP